MLSAIFGIASAAVFNGLLNYLVRTYYQLNVNEQTLDQHLQIISETEGVRLVTPARDSSNKVTLQVYVDAESPFVAQQN